MSLNDLSSSPATGSTPPAALIKDSTDRAFKADVIDASLEAPVLVDFWAPWCGPCRQLGPAIEKAVLAAKGKVKLVKIDIDKHPAYAGQLRVQSIPAVFAFAGGRPVDGFMGALPDSQVKQFVDRIAGQAPAGETDETGLGCGIVDAAARPVRASCDRRDVHDPGPAGGGLAVVDHQTRGFAGGGGLGDQDARR